MWSLATEIPDGLVYAVIPVSLTLIVALMAWIVRELSRISVANARSEQTLEDHERRIGELEHRRQ